MKRAGRRVLVSVVLWLSVGLALAVVSAMGITVWVELRNPTLRNYSEEPEPGWPEEPPVGWPQPGYTEAYESFGCEWISAEFGNWRGAPPTTLMPEPPPLAGGLIQGWMGCWRVGWPMRSLKALDIAESFDIGPNTNNVRRKFWSIPLPMRFGLQTYYGLPIRLPTRPMWPGLLVNTLFFTALVWVPFHALAFVRRAYRRKRGRCVGCGYDLRGSAGAAVCPECGRGVLRAAQR